MPRRVMSTEVEPPLRTSSSGNRAATAARSAFFRDPSGSQACFAATGARWPSAEKVTWDPRSSRISPQVSASQSPSRSASSRSAARAASRSAGVRSSW